MSTYPRLDNPATGESYRFIQTGDDTNGQLFQFEWTVEPGGSAPEHLHPHQSETFTVTNGEIHLVVNGVDHLLRSGETMVVPPGTAHTFRNDANDTVRGIVEMNPSMHMHRFFETLAGLARDGKITASGAPKNPLQLAVILHEFRDQSVPTIVPRTVQRALFTPLAAIGRALGYRATYPAYRSERVRGS